MRTTSRTNGNNRYTPSPAAEKPEYFASTGRPPMDGDRVLSPGPVGEGNGKGVKRTKSLMQRFRAMVSRVPSTDPGSRCLSRWLAARQSQRTRTFRCSSASDRITGQRRQGWASFSLERGYSGDHG